MCAQRCFVFRRSCCDLAAKRHRACLRRVILPNYELLRKAPINRASSPSVVPQPIQRTVIARAAATDPRTYVPNFLTMFKTSRPPRRFTRVFVRAKVFMQSASTTSRMVFEQCGECGFEESESCRSELIDRLPEIKKEARRRKIEDAKSTHDPQPPLLGKCRGT